MKFHSPWPLGFVYASDVKVSRIRISGIVAVPRPFDPMAELQWGDPVISQRLLREHLDQSSDSASRRIPIVETQIARLKKILPAPPAKILDAACGPGLYALRLAQAGYSVQGFDIGPAVIAHAQECAHRDKVDAQFFCANLRTFSSGTTNTKFDAILLIYHVLEAFPRAQQRAILHRLFTALTPGGTLIVEARTRVEQESGTLGAWDVVAHSLLSDTPHLLLTDTTYDDRRHIYILREIAVFDDGSAATQQTTSRLLRFAEIDSFFAIAGGQVRAIYDGWTRFKANELSSSVLIVAEVAT